MISISYVILALALAYTAVRVCQLTYPATHRKLCLLSTMLALGILVASLTLGYIGLQGMGVLK